MRHIKTKRAGPAAQAMFNDLVTNCQSQYDACTNPTMRAVGGPESFAICGKVYIMQKLVVSALIASAALATFPVQATVVNVGSYSLQDNATFGVPTGVHTNGAQTGPTINAHVNQDGSAVTFSTSSGDLHSNGGGEATISGDPTFTDLNVLFAKAWDRMTFSFAGDDGDFTLLVNGSALFTGPGCTICLISTSGENKFVLEGPGITSLAFTFDPGVDNAKQFRVDELSTAPVPEPASWALMIGGLSLVGAALRRRATRVQFA